MSKNKYKKCPKCGKIFERNLENFWKKTSAKDGLHYCCKECGRKMKKIYNQTQYKKNPLRIHKHNIKNLYGITLEEYNVILKQQKGRCAICGLTLDQMASNNRFKNNKHFQIDHDHKTKKIRGLLCGNCNRCLGFLKNNPLILLNAVKYLQKNKKRVDKI